MLQRCLIFLLLTSLVVDAGSINTVNNNATDIYLESKNQGTTVGYRFSLSSNILSVTMNASNSNSSGELVRYAILPSLMFESASAPFFNTTVNYTNTVNMMDKSSQYKNWGNGLKVNKSGSVYEISGTWTNPGNNHKPQFGAKMYIAENGTTYNGMKLDPNEIAMEFSILNYTYELSNTSLSYSQFVFSKQGFNPTSNSSQYSDGMATILYVNNTALVDGRSQPVNVTGGQDALDTNPRNYSTIFNLTGQVGQEMRFYFSNSNGAKNVTFGERLQLNVSALNSISKMEENAASVYKAPAWIAVATSVVFAVLALPFIY